jgi:ABC-type phosphate transport system permease subunit
MKALIAILSVALLVAGNTANAGFFLSQENSKTYSFKFKFQKAQQSPMQVYSVETAAPTYEEAYTRAAQDCYEHFRDAQIRFTTEIGEQIIDACANPS